MDSPTQDQYATHLWNCWTFRRTRSQKFYAQSSYSFIKSHDEILAIVRDKAAGQAIRHNLIEPRIFTFNDTIIIAQPTDLENEYLAIKAFATTVRRFISYSLTKNLFFRGAFSIGFYLMGQNHDLIMGDAVTDAVSWYEQPEFIGVIATPKASRSLKNTSFEKSIKKSRGSARLYPLRG